MKIRLSKASAKPALIEARHLCMMMRGVEQQNSTMVTSSVLGVFRDSVATREEFLSLIGRRAA
jgi:GTP cyclohydrolase I